MLAREIQWARHTIFMPVLVLIAHVISSVHIKFYGSWKQSLLK